MSVTRAIATQRRPSRRSPFGRLIRRPLAVAASGVVAVIVLACLAAPLVAPYDPGKTDFAQSLAGPSWSHLLGTDQLGRDLLSRLLHGGQPSLGYAAIVLVVSLLVGISLGVLAGYLGGWVDRAVSALADMGLAIPVLIMTIVILTVFDGMFWFAMILLGVLVSPPIIRNIRGVVIGVRRDNFVDAARVAGLTPFGIMRTHILPRIVGPLLVQVTLVAGLAISFTVGLGFLGFGPQPPTPTWGGMILEASQVLSRSSWPMMVVGTLLALLVLALMVLGDTIREVAVDPWAAVAPAARRRRRAVRATAPDPAELASAREAPDGSAEPAAEPSLLEVEDLWIAYRSSSGATTVVDGMSFDVRAGETVGIVGESGSGKSTVARAVARILPASGEVTRGTVRFRGREVFELQGGELRRFRGGEVAYVFQDAMSTLVPTSRIGDQLVRVLRLHQKLSRGQAKKRAIELLRRVRIADAEAVAKKYPHNLSGGLAQRVAIARAIANDPALLIADEPTTALDASIRLGILELLQSLTKESGMSLVIVSHDWDVVNHLCDRAFVMYAGQVVEEAPVRTVLEANAHPYTRALLECRPTTTSDQERPLPSIPGQVAPPGSWGSGCRFAARCALRQPACTAQPIPLEAVSPAHASRCLFAEQLLGEEHPVAADERRVLR